jgi:hypothetical protein
VASYMDDWDTSAWNADYYDIVEHYFWAPGTLGRRPKENVQPREIFRRLRRNEEPLNHVLMLFFRLAPRDLTQGLFERWFAESTTPDFRVQNRYQVNELISSGFTQPDLFFVHPSMSFMIEMKVDAKSSADQVLKYAVLSHLESKGSKTSKPMRLCYLGRGGIETIFRGSPTSTEEIIDRVRKLNQREYQRKWKFLDESDWESIYDRLSSMKLQFRTYPELDRLLADYEESIDARSPYADTVFGLIEGARAELRCRRLGVAPIEP